jgi:regulator of protease activity HflC (stomatin/prohibitin superfamily)
VTTGFIIVIVIMLLIIFNGIKVIPEHQRAVVYRLGRLIGIKGPGRIFILPLIDQIIRVDLRTVALAMPVQEIRTKDKQMLKVQLIANIAVKEPEKAVVEVVDYYGTSNQIAQSVVRNVLGKYDIRDIPWNHSEIVESLQEALDKQADPYGVKITLIDLKDTDVPEVEILRKL